MPTLKVGDKEIDVTPDQRLVLAIEQCGVEIGHRCGGNARCTTCRVEFEVGEPDSMTEAEYAKLKEKDLLGKARLSCQIVTSHNMSVTPLMTRQSEGWTDTGPAPEPVVQPEAAWYPIEELAEGRREKRPDPDG